MKKEVEIKRVQIALEAAKEAYFDILSDTSEDYLNHNALIVQLACALLAPKND